MMKNNEYARIMMLLSLHPFLIRLTPSSSPPSHHHPLLLKTRPRTAKSIVQQIEQLSTHTIHVHVATVTSVEGPLPQQGAVDTARCRHPRQTSVLEPHITVEFHRTAGPGAVRARDPVAAVERRSAKKEARERPVCELCRCGGRKRERERLFLSTPLWSPRWGRVWPSSSRWGRGKSRE